MKYANRIGMRWDKDSFQDKFLSKMYGCAIGRGLIKILVHPVFSKIGGVFLSSSLSKPMIGKFVKNHSIDLSRYTAQNFKSYNEFFTRKLKKEKLNINMQKTAFISPCDSKLSVSEITEDGIFHIKHTDYTIASLLKDESLSKEFIGGTAFTFRLTVDDYHRYCYPDWCFKHEGKKVKGILHTVNPVANDKYPIYKENAREYCVLDTQNFGKVLFMEVGALMVGKISNHHLIGEFNRGDEKGMFEFGGSTIILMTQKDTVTVDEDILLNSKDGYETIVSIGEKIGAKK